MSEDTQESPKKAAKKSLDEIQASQDQASPIVNDRDRDLAKQIFGTLVLEEFAGFVEGSGPHKQAEVADKLAKVAGKTKRFVAAFQTHFGK